MKGNKMAIEDSLERIASALERIAKAQEENTRINREYKEYLAKQKPLYVGTPKGPNPIQEEWTSRAETEDEAHARGFIQAILAADSEATAPMDTADAPEGMKWTQPAEPEKELTFEELKAFLHARGYDFPKGTKRTTLLKAWGAHKDEPVKAAEPSPVEPPPLDVDPVGYAPSITAPEAPVVEEKKPMTREEAMDRIRKNYAATEEDKADFIEALASVGAKMFQEVQDGSFDALVAKYEELKAGRAANA
jgi:hypothetical protein